MLVGWATRWLGRLAGRAASSAPGSLALRVDPQILRRLSSGFPRGTLMVTGTNGKTTTAMWVEAMLRADGWRVVRNRSGANLLGGLTTALLERASCTLEPRADGAVLETDEATVPRAAAETRPRVLAVTNFFRDQLDRYGEVTTTVSLVARGIEALDPTATLVLNADDPHVAFLGRGRANVLYYGLAWQAVTPADDDPGDARFCPACGQALEYTRRFYGHLGHWGCPACGFQRPVPTVTVEAVQDQPGRRTAVMDLGGERVEVSLTLPGAYNVYNAACAAAVGRAVGVHGPSMAEGFLSSRGAFGRMEAVAWQGQELRLALVKNPAGFNQVLRAVAEDARPKQVVVAINDRYADGQDVSWLWDVDLETLAPRLHALHWYAAGLRAQDMAVRLKYAGVSPTRVEVVRGPALNALARARQRVPEAVVYVLPTYTAMMEIRTGLERAGVVRSFREG